MLIYITTFAMSQNCKMQGCKRYWVNGLNCILRIIGIVEKELHYLFITSSSSHFFNKADFEQYLLSPRPNFFSRWNALELGQYFWVFWILGFNDLPACNKSIGIFQLTLYLSGYFYTRERCKFAPLSKNQLVRDRNNFKTFYLLKLFFLKFF